MRLENKVALVTGGGSGIGAATCVRFAQEGAGVVVTDINADAAASVAAEIVAAGGQAISLGQDVTNEGLWGEVISAAVEHYGQLDILVNNAGIGQFASVEDATLEDWRAIHSVNLDAVFLGTREAIKVMKANGGSIVNISSIEGIIGEPMLAAYNSSKGGVRVFTKSAALHCANNRYNIRVNSVHPGYIETPMVGDALNDLDESASTAFVTNLIASIPLGALGTATDVANGILFLASDESSYMTGSELIIDGGYTAK